MSLKSKSRSLGRVIRRLTGVKLPVAMKVAKMVVRDRSYEVPYEMLECKPFGCGMDCCGPEGYYLVGPKGEYRVR